MNAKLISPDFPYYVTTMPFVGTNSFITSGYPIFPNYCRNEFWKSEILQISLECRANHIETKNENLMDLIKDIDLEFEYLELEDYDNETQKSFRNSVMQLKDLLNDVHIEKVPEVLTFHKGYFGLVWSAKNDDSIYLYSIPGEKLFYNKVSKDSDEILRVNPEKKDFEDLINKINLMV